MKKAIVIGAVIAAFAIPSAVYAVKKAGNWHSGWVETKFERHDVNKDGFITKDEMPERFTEMFDQADANKDGKLDVTEVETAVSDMKDRKLSKMIKRFDRDSDGLVSKDEVTAFIVEKFDKADKDGDGNLSKDEIMDMKPMRGFGKHHKGHGDKG